MLPLADVGDDRQQALGLGIAARAEHAHQALGGGADLVGQLVEADGALMVSPGSLWTAAKHKIPILMVMHNNRYYFQEVMHLQAMANRHMRDPHTARIGTEIANPNIDFAKLAQSMGVHAEGPITDPEKLGPALQRAVAIVKSGEPALVDVVSQGR